MKSSIQQIRERFDNDVERFSNLDTGQAATMDARLCMELVTQAAAATTPAARDLLDLGCGAGNYSLLLLQRLPNLNCTLIDLSKPMLDRAVQRLTPATRGEIFPVQGDMRDLGLGEARFDIVLTAATLHHLRADAEWYALFRKVFRALRPGGSLWIFDLIEQATPPIQQMMWQRYGAYLSSLKGGGEPGEKYRDAVFTYVAAEDTPRSLPFQLHCLQSAGFTDIDILHKNGPFAAFGAVKRA